MAEAVQQQVNPRAQLQQARIAAQKNSTQNRASNSRSNRSKIQQQVTSRNVDIEAITNRPRNEREEEALENEKRVKELNNKKRLHIQKMQTRAMLQNYIAAPREFTELQTPQEQEQQQMQEAYDEYQEENANVMQSTEGTLKKVRQLAKNKQELMAKARKVKESIDKAKKAKDILWTAGQYVTLTEHVAPAAAETIFTGGGTIGAYRFVKLLAGKDDFFPGMFSFLEPSRYKLSDITSWLSMLHFAYFSLIALLVIAAILAALILLVIPIALAGTVAGTASYQLYNFLQTYIL